VSEKAEAIAIIEECREIHKQWADWQDSKGDWKAETKPDDVGGPEYHREWVAKYEKVLRVLKGKSE